MGNSHSQDRVSRTGVAVRPFSLHQEQTVATEAELDYALSKRNSTHTQLEWKRRPQQLQHKLIRRTSSHLGYRPRSASLRRIRSVQRLRLLKNSPSKTTTKMEAENKKLQEEIALLAACARGDLSKVEKLVDLGVDVNSSDQNHMTTLHYAAMHTRVEVIKSLISRGAEVNSTDIKRGFSAMHWVVINAVQKSSSTNRLEGSLTALAKAGCNVNATDFNFATPLHIASRKGNRDGIQVLLRLGADPNKADITGRNCFEVAKNEQMKIYMKILLDMSPKKDDQRKTRHSYHVLEIPTRHSYHVLEIPPPSIPAPLPPVLSPGLEYAGKSSQEEHIYNTLKFHSPSSSPSRLRTSSVTPSPPPSSPSRFRPSSVTPSPPPRRHRQYLQYAKEPHLYHILEPIPIRRHPELVQHNVFPGRENPANSNSHVLCVSNN